jgi:hypothetical protein
LAVAKISSRTLDIPATGKTYRLTAKQSNNHPSDNIFASAAVESCGTAPFSFGFATQYADANPCGCKVVEVVKTSTTFIKIVI